jgi:hypothetical protein
VKPARFHRSASRELDDAADRYHEQRPGLGRDFLEEVYQRLAIIQADPERWPFFQGAMVRKCSLKRFTYAIYDLDREDHIWVAAIAHHKRKPGYWMRRRPG